MLGAGNISEPHLLGLRGLQETVEVIAVCDINVERARAVQKQHAIPHSFHQLETMLEQVQPDVVHVLLPAPLHGEPSEICLTSGCHIFVEKPFCTTVEECERLQRIAAANGLRIGVNHNLAFFPPFPVLIEAVRACRFGAIENVQVVYALPMPGLESFTPNHWMFTAPDRVMLELGPHPMSLACRLLGRPLNASALASGQIMLANGVRFFRSWQSSLVHERGTSQCTLLLGAGSLSATAHVLGEDAEAIVDLRRGTLQIMEKTPYLRSDDLVNGWRNAKSLARQSIREFKAYALGAAGIRPPYQRQVVSIAASIAAFYRALAAGNTPRIDGAEGTAVVEACQMTIQSALTSFDQREAQVASA